MLNTKVTYKGSDFKEGGAAANLGFPPSYSSESSYSFFANLCVEIWAFVLNNNVRTFDIDMKKAQLRQLRIPSSVLLVDESQDMDECQVAWIASQKQFGTHIFFVGDSAQCIYGFRGAKSSYVIISTVLTLSLPEVGGLAQLLQQWQISRYLPSIIRFRLVEIKNCGDRIEYRVVAKKVEK